jgi:hypothetical protein
MPEERANRHKVRPLLDKRRREEVPEEMKVELDPCDLADLGDRPPEKVRLLTVRDVKNILSPPLLSTDDGQGCLIFFLP